MTDLSIPVKEVRRRVSPTMFAAITPDPVRFDVQGKTLTVSFDATLGEAEKARALQVLTSRDDSEMTNAQAVAAALAANQTFLGLTSPTNLQVVAQVRALTRQVNALARIVRNLPGTD